MKFKFLLMSVLIAAAVPTVSASTDSQASQAPVAGEPKVEVVSTMDEALAQAKKTKKPIFVNFYADWAAPCQAMDRYVFSDEAFAKYMNKNFVVLKADTRTAEGKELVKKFNVKSFAYFVVLDRDGNLIQPIGRGGKLPEFKDEVAIALNPKTTLAYTKKKYESGKYSKKDLYNYLNASLVAGGAKNFQKLSSEYMAMLSPKDYLDEANWKVIRNVRDTDSDFFRYVVANRVLFEDKFGAKDVQAFLERPYANKALNSAMTDEGTTLDEIRGILADMDKAGVADSSIVRTVYGIGILRREGKISELLKYMDEHAAQLKSQLALRPTIESSFNFKNMDDATREKVRKYLARRADEEGGSYSKRLRGLSETLAPVAPGGIEFDHSDFAGVIARAKKEGKPVFIDCYTSWCGPCRALSTNVFTDAEVAKYFNSTFVSAKYDMEVGEGPELAKKYGISAYPTMLVLDSDGNLKDRIVGYKTPQQLIDAAKAILSK